MTKQIEFFDLIHARSELKNNQEPFILINAPGTSRFLGPILIDKIFKILTNEFCPEQIIFRVDRDLPALFYAIRFGYHNIIYTGNSISAQKLLTDWLKQHLV